MAREKVGSDLMQVRFPDGTFDLIDAVSDNRSCFIRDAVSAALGGGGVRRVPRKKNSNVSSGRGADAAVLLEALRKRSMSSREAEKLMGWLGLRYANAEKRLLQDGSVYSDGGILVAVSDV